jgi:hypothetical protein
MLDVNLFDMVPLWVIFLITAAFVLALIEIGFHVGKKKGPLNLSEGGAPIASITGSTLGLLAFLLAFTFGMAANKFESRRQLLLDEVNAVGTCNLRAGLTPEPQRTEIRKQLREYVHLRANIAKDLATFDETIKRCEVIHDELWKQAQLVAKQDPLNEMYPLFVISLNEVIDLHTKRIVVGGYRIPNVIWLALYVVAGLSMIAVGYQFGRVGKRDVSISFVLALAFSIVIYLIADLDCIDHGTLRVSQRPMAELEEDLQSPPSP